MREYRIDGIRFVWNFSMYSAVNYHLATADMLRDMFEFLVIPFVVGTYRLS